MTSALGVQRPGFSQKPAQNYLNLASVNKMIPPCNRSETLGGGCELVGGGEAGEGGLQLGHQPGEEDVRSDAGHDGHTLPGGLNIPGVTLQSLSLAHKKVVFGDNTSWTW